MMLELLFWIGAVGSVYSYLLYPLLLRPLVSRPLDTPQQLPDEELPLLSVVIAAHNEAARIEDKLDDVLRQDYPGDKLEVIVVSDASSDGTDELVKAYADRGVRLFRQDGHLGKESAQLLGVSMAGSDLLVFTDAATEIGPGSFRAMAGLLADADIGAVSSEDRFRSRDGRIVGEGLYVKFEMWLRRLESRAAGLVGLSGSLFATRRSVCAEWLPHVCSDFRTGLACARQNLRAVSAPEVVGIYSDLKDPSQEYARKKRTILRGMTGLAAAREILDFRRYGLFAFQVWSHKVMRWATPWFLALLAVTSVICAPRAGVFALAVAVQAAFYGLAALGWLVPVLRENTLVRVPYYFVQVNMAMAQAFIEYARGRRVVVWQPSAR